MSLNFQADADGEDFAVLTGASEPAPDAPSPAANEEYLTKYADDIASMGYDAAQFAQRYDVPVWIRFERVRGF